jgi:predicted ATPase
MIGVHRVIIESIRVKYEFVLRRNITIIQGDSATGKTTLVELLRDYRRTGNRGVIRVQSDKTCAVFDGNEDNWREQIQLIKDSIVFIDEGFLFIRKKEFAEVIRETDNYYVLVTRESLPCIPYSIKEIYGIRTSGKFHYPNQVYHEFFPIYGEDWLEHEGSNQSEDKRVS